MLDDLLVPPWAKLALIAVAAGALFCSGMALQGRLKDGEIAQIRLAHQTLLTAAEKAKNDAEKAAHDAEQKAVHDLAALSDSYLKEQEHEKAAADQRVADLLSDNVRLRVAVHRPASGCTLPGTAAAASGGDDQATEALPGPIAARFTRRYADYNALVGQLDMCQSTIERYLVLAGPKPPH